MRFKNFKITFKFSNECLKIFQLATVGTKNLSDIFAN